MRQRRGNARRAARPPAAGSRRGSESSGTEPRGAGRGEKRPLLPRLPIDEPDLDVGDLAEAAARRCRSRSASMLGLNRSWKLIAAVRRRSRGRSSRMRRAAVEVFAHRLLDEHRGARPEGSCSTPSDLIAGHREVEHGVGRRARVGERREDRGHAERLRRVSRPPPAARRTDRRPETPSRRYAGRCAVRTMRAGADDDDRPRTRRHVPRCRSSHGRRVRVIESVRAAHGGSSSTSPSIRPAPARPSTGSCSDCISRSHSCHARRSTPSARRTRARDVEAVLHTRRPSRGDGRAGECPCCRTPTVRRLSTTSGQTRR